MDPATAPYRTVEEPARVEFDVRGSRFIGYVAPVESVDAARAFIKRVREEHADATHNVPAYRVRASPVAEWSSDDGEPGGSAGRPELHYLQQQDLVDVVVVVTRYFGGTKLGVGGLVRAYTEGAKRAVEAAGIVERVPREPVSVDVAYEDAGTVQALLESTGVEYAAEYGARVRFDARVPVADADAFRDRVRSATRGRARIT